MTGMSPPRLPVCGGGRNRILCRGGVAVSLLSIGTSTVTVSSDDEGIVEDVQEVLEAFNTAISDIHSMISSTGVLPSDSSIRIVDDFLRTTIFNRVEGLGGPFSSLAEIGITTGEDFDPEAATVFSLDEDAFREALLDERANVEQLFVNDAETGVADQLFEYLDDVTALSGFLNERAKTNGIIDDQIEGFNVQIERVEARVEQKQARLEKQFIRMEQVQSSFQTMYASLGGISSGLGAF
ncbi:MAG: flagellar filament capping protein FliD [bacterium]|nr:flagellar filament capping protein FliD [bacterium]